MSTDELHKRLFELHFGAIALASTASAIHAAMERDPTPADSYRPALMPLSANLEAHANGIMALRDCKVDV